MIKKLQQLVLGNPRDIHDPHVFHNVSLIAFLAWIGLGADGLSSSAYGPDEAFRALGAHVHLSPLLALMTAVTIAVISIAYSNLIEHFPGGGGGYLVATKLLGEKAGVVSGCALLVDYVLTISVSVASGCDALWSFLPPHWGSYKLVVEVAVLLFLVVLNLRGVKESVMFLAPIFIVFILTHVWAIVYAIGSRFTALPTVFRGTTHDFHAAVSQLGLVPVALILLRAYSMGGGTYTGIEAVSNGVTMLREPRIQTGKRTMALMAASLAFTAGGILIGYLLTNAAPVEGQTMNAVLFSHLFAAWQIGTVPVGKALIVLTLAAEAALLFVAAQTGFLDGPRVLANMAVDSWLPHRFAQLSSRLVTNNGIYLMGFAATATLLYTHGDVTTLVVMYSINVFLTFTLTMLGMSLYWWHRRGADAHWKTQLSIQGAGLVMCVSILSITLYEKFAEGGWMTVAITALTIGACFLIRRHYRTVRQHLARLDDILQGIPAHVTPEKKPLDRLQPTAVVSVNGFSGFGLHQILSIQKLLPGYVKNFIFISAAVVDSGHFKGVDEIAHLEAKTQDDLERYVAWARGQGLNAESHMATGTEAVTALEDLCAGLAKDFPRLIVFAGKLIFKEETWYQRFLHNETASMLQRRLQFDGIQTIVLPIRLL